MSLQTHVQKGSLTVFRFFLDRFSGTKPGWETNYVNYTFSLKRERICLFCEDTPPSSLSIFLFRVNKGGLNSRRR